MRVVLYWVCKKKRISTKKPFPRLLKIVMISTNGKRFNILSKVFQNPLKKIVRPPRTICSYILFCYVRGALGLNIASKRRCQIIVPKSDFQRLFGDSKFWIRLTRKCLSQINPGFLLIKNSKGFDIVRFFHWSYSMNLFKSIK